MSWWLLGLVFGLFVRHLRRDGTRARDTTPPLEVVVRDHVALESGECLGLAICLRPPPREVGLRRQGALRLARAGHAAHKRQQVRGRLVRGRASCSDSSPQARRAASREARTAQQDCAKQRRVFPPGHRYHYLTAAHHRLPVRRSSGPAPSLSACSGAPVRRAPCPVRGDLSLRDLHAGCTLPKFV